MIGALTIFYSLLGVSLFVPVVGGLYSRRAGSGAALGAITAGVIVLLVARFAFRAEPWVDPTLAGLIAAALAFAGAIVLSRQ